VSGGNVDLSSSGSSLAAWNGSAFSATWQLTWQTIQQLNQFLNGWGTYGRNGLIHEGIFLDFCCVIFCLWGTSLPRSLVNVNSLYDGADLTVLNRTIPTESLGPTITFFFWICIAASRAVKRWDVLASS
jgi:hypothetical protein